MDKTKADKKKENDLVDAGSEYSFPASDPPSYMGGTSVAGPPPHEEPAREPVCHELTDPKEGKPATPSRAGEQPRKAPGDGGND